MGRCLIVANLTLGTEGLDRAVRDRIERGDRSFYLVVPVTIPEYETTTASQGFSAGEHPTGAELTKTRRAVKEDSRWRQAVLEEAGREAQRRLDEAIEKIKAEGGEADGRVGDPDPVAAVKGVLQEEEFDEILISILPTGFSRWLRLDVPSRVVRMAKVPVTTIKPET